MTTEVDRPDHRSIGEVLNLLKEEFPDVTISKIRFLESQGLLDPERTPSGYRKFYEDDIDRLRWILRQQREHFLPLKVIKERLDDTDGEELPPDEPPAPPLPEQQTLVPPERPRPRLFADREAPAAPVVAAPVTGSVSLTREELAIAAGISVDLVAELGRYGLIDGAVLGSSTVYDDRALVVAKLAADFVAHGLEARHLRMYKVAAEREAGVIEQLVSPLVRSSARDEAVDKVEELAELGARMRAAMLQKSLRGVVR